jgi:hypothetical protein
VAQAPGGPAGAMDRTSRDRKGAVDHKYKLNMRGNLCEMEISFRPQDALTPALFYEDRRPVKGASWVGELGCAHSSIRASALVGLAHGGCPKVRAGCPISRRAKKAQEGCELAGTDAGHAKSSLRDPPMAGSSRAGRPGAASLQVPVPEAAHPPVGHRRHDQAFLLAPPGHGRSQVPPARHRADQAVGGLDQDGAQ